MGIPERTQHSKGVSCAVPHRQHQRVADKGPLISSVLHDNRIQNAVAKGQPDQGMLKENLAALPNYLLPYGTNHLYQLVGAHVRLVQIFNFLWRAVEHKLPQYLTAAGYLLDAGGQLAVGKGSGSPLPQIGR